MFGPGRNKEKIREHVPKPNLSESIRTMTGAVHIPLCTTGHHAPVIEALPVGFGQMAMIYEGYNSEKVYVDVTVRFGKEGTVAPVSLIWEDGVTYQIDRVVNVRRAASTVAGGNGIRYTCMISGRESHLYYEENNRWFMERK